MMSCKKIKSIIIFTFALFLCSNSYTQSVNFDWVKATSGTVSETLESLAIDASGNVYSVGYFGGISNFDPTSSNISDTTSGGSDMYIQKQDNNGNFLWVKTIGGSGNDFATKIDIDTSGNLIIGGGFNDTVDFDPGPGVYNINAPNVIHSFLLKLDSNGNFIWAKKFNAAQYGLQIFDLELSESGYLYMTGFFSYTCDFDLGPNTFNLSTNGSADWYLVKYDLDGELIWADTYPANGSDRGIALAIDENENIVNVGFIGNSEVVRKIDSSGTQVWQEDLYGWYLDFLDVETDSNNEIILCGKLHGNVDVDPDTTVYWLNAINEQAFCMKLSENGNFNWAYLIGGAGQEEYTTLQIGSMNNIYLSGHIGSVTDFDPGPSAYLFYPLWNSQDPFVQKMDSTGTFKWVKTLDGTGFESVNDFKLDTYDNAYIVGSFENQVDFDPSPLNYYITGNQFGSAYIEKFSVCAPNYGIDSVVACDSILWQNGVIYTSDTVTPVFNLLSANTIGCDSIITLELTLKNSSHWTDSLAICEPYTWLDGNTYSSSTNTPTYTLTNAVGCDSVIHLDLTYNGTYVSAFISNAITVKAFPSGGQYQWLDCNNGYTPIPGATDVTYIASQNGSYAALVIINGCTDTTDCVTIGEIGIDENSLSSKISVFPNPTKGEVTVSFGEVQEKTKITLIDLVGKELYSKTDTSSESILLTIIGETGTYFLKVEDENGRIGVYKIEKLRQ